MERQQTQSGFWGFFVDRWRVTLLAILLFVLGGFAALTSLPLESDPEVKVPIAIITTTYPGASPTDIEKLITERLEEDLQNLDDIDSMTSSSSEGVSRITIQFEAQADLEESIRNLRDEVDNIKRVLPQGAEDPIVTEVSVSDEPIVIISLLGNLPPGDLKYYGDELTTTLESVPGVSEVIVSGIENREIQIFIDRGKAQGLRVSLSQIVNTLQSSHLDAPIGTIKTNDFYYQASFKGQFENAEDLKKLSITTIDGKTLFLEDIAQVREAFAEARTSSQIFTDKSNSYKKAITLQVKKKTGANITNTVDKVKEALEVFQDEQLPESMEIILTNDFSKFVREDIKILGTSAIQTVLIIFIVLFLALGVKEALLVGLSIPLIFFLSFIFLGFVGETLNSLVLFSLILSLGLVVDTSIVIMEGVYHGIREKGMSAREAALRAIDTYKAPLISGTLTTVAAFFPMTLMSGIMGEYVKHIPITVSITLFCSLFVAIFILSAIAAHIFDRVKREKKVHTPLLSYIVDPLRRWYLKHLRRIIESKKIRRSWLAGMILAFFLSFSLPIIGLLKVQMFPGIDAGFFTVNIDLPVGSTLEQTKEVTSRVEKYIEQLPEVENFVSVVGGAGDLISSISVSRSAGAGGSHHASITVNLTDKEERPISSRVISDTLREQVKEITNADVAITELAAGPPVGAPIEVRIKGDDIAQLDITAQIILKELLAMKGTRDVSTDISRGTGEFHITPKRDLLSYYGVTAQQISNELRTAVYGNDRIKILRAGEEIPLVVMMDFRQQECLNDKRNAILSKRDDLTVCTNVPTSIETIESLLIATPKGTIPVSELANIKLYPAITSINHIDTEKVVRVRSHTTEDTLPVDITNALQKRISEIQDQIPEDVIIDLGGETESTDESFQSLGNAMFVGIFAIALILVLQFNSFRQPFIILLTVPLALIGVFFGLALLGKNFSFPGFIGIVALSGVVVNDAIVLIDRINKNREKGKTIKEAIITAAGERLQPIILTTITTSLGVLPLAFASEIWADLAITIAVGIIFATVLTLIIIPILYHGMYRKQRKKEQELQ